MTEFEVLGLLFLIPIIWIMMSVIVKETRDFWRSGHGKRNRR